jgi:hypothetical protein
MTGMPTHFVVRGFTVLRSSETFLVSSLPPHLRHGLASVLRTGLQHRAGIGILPAGDPLLPAQ